NRLLACREPAGVLGKQPSSDLHPLARVRGTFDGVEDALIGEAILEIGTRRFAVDDGPDEIVHRVRERVLVTDDVPGRPPGADVWMRSVGDRDRAEAAEWPRLDVE